MSAYRRPNSAVFAALLESEFDRAGGFMEMLRDVLDNDDGGDLSDIVYSLSVDINEVLDDL
jgi:hypothetical protein